MWIDEKSNQDDINGKKFVALVNVYSNVALVSEEEMASRNDIGISSITVDDEMATKVENQKYDYTVVLPENTTTASVNIETTDSNSSVKIEKLDGLTHNNSSIKKVASSRTLNLTSGDNYFKVTVISENKEKTEDYILKIGVLHVGYSMPFDYTGDVQYFKTPSSGNYKIELWGASGGDTILIDSGSYNEKGGNGAYTTGNIKLTEDDNLYIYVGQQGFINGTAYNGGGTANLGTANNSAGGGGSTDIRTYKSDDSAWDNFDSLKSRIMVAGGGGGATNYTSSGSSFTTWQQAAGGYAGGLIAGDGNNSHEGTNLNLVNQVAGGATQIVGGQRGGSNEAGSLSWGENGSFGKGGDTLPSNTWGGGGSGGSGYYGGGGAGNISGHHGSGGGGSSFISGHLGCDAIDESSTSSNIIHTGQANHYSGYIFTDTVMIDGLGYKWTDTKGSAVVGQPTYDGLNTQNGNDGNGYAKITYLGK